MRLIHTITLELKQFFNNIPDYVILSHTWGDDEVTFDDMAKPRTELESMAGYQKVVRCCKQAAQDGFEYAWIDTCCIDKRSSSELSEAINSMWNWYWNAAICYAFLVDVPEVIDSPLLDAFRKSRWFTRGWTLQELLAPAVVEFYSAGWTHIGTKSSLLWIISSVTRIDQLVLSSRLKIQSASVAQKFSWAATRETSREEDSAYCLLGLLNVNMPMLYGEGKRSFYRLQLELMKMTNEHTLFAWEPTGAIAASHGLLANSPRGFYNSGRIRASKIQVPSFVMTNKGLLIRLPCLPHPTIPNQTIAILNCYHDDPASARRGQVGILLEMHGNGWYRRVAQSQLQGLGYEEASKAEWREIYTAESDGVVYAGQFLRVPYCISIVTTEPFASRFSVVHMAKWCPKFIDNSYVATEGPLQLEASPLLNLDPDDYVGILFKDDHQTFLLAFGQRGYSTIWIDVQADVAINQFEDMMKKVRLEVIVNTDLCRDLLDTRLTDGSSLMVHAKKMRQDGLVGWRIEIDAAAAVVESDVAMDDG